MRERLQRVFMHEKGERVSGGREQNKKKNRSGRRNKRKKTAAGDRRWRLQNLNKTEKRMEWRLRGL